MKQSEAVRIVGLLNGYFPARPIPQETVALWATELAPFRYDDALTAVRAIGTNARFMPALAELLDDVRDAQRERERAERPQLTAGEEHFVDFAVWHREIATPEQRKTLARFMDGLRIGARKEGK